MDLVEEKTGLGASRMKSADQEALIGMLRWKSAKTDNWFVNALSSENLVVSSGIN